MKKLIFILSFLILGLQLSYAQISEERYAELQKGFDVIKGLNQIELNGADIEFLVARNKGQYFITFGILELSDYYNYYFSNAQEIAQAVKFTPLKEVKGAGRNEWVFYIPYSKKINDAYGITGDELIKYMNENNKESIACYMIGLIPEELENNAGRMAIGLPVLLDYWDVLGEVMEKLYNDSK